MMPRLPLPPAFCLTAATYRPPAAAAVEASRRYTLSCMEFFPLPFAILVSEPKRMMHSSTPLEQIAANT